MNNVNLSSNLVEVHPQTVSLRTRRNKTRSVVFMVILKRGVRGGLKKERPGGRESTSNMMNMN